MQEWCRINQPDQLKQEPHRGCYIVEVGFVVIGSVGAADAFLYGTGFDERYGFDEQKQ